MSTAAERRAATAAKFRPPGAPVRTPEVDPDAPRPDDDPEVPLAVRGVRPPRTDPVRLTVDITPARHRWLLEWEADVAWRAGTKSRDVSNQLVLEALLGELHESVRLQEAIERRVRKMLDERKGEKRR